MIVHTQAKSTFDAVAMTEKVLSYLYAFWKNENHAELADVTTKAMIEGNSLYKIYTPDYTKSYACLQAIDNEIKKGLEDMASKDKLVHKFLWVVDELTDDRLFIRKTYLLNEFFATEKEVREKLGNGQYIITRSPIKIERPL